MTDRLNLLLVEDDPNDISQITAALRDHIGGRPINVDVARRLADVASGNHPEVDVVILDLGLPDSSGIETLKALQNALPNAPVVVLTGGEEESVGMQAIAEGAQDYLGKSEMEPALLLRSLRYAIERSRLASELEEARARERAARDRASLESLRSGSPESGPAAAAAYRDHLEEFLTSAYSDPQELIERAAIALTEPDLVGLDTVDVHLEAIDEITELVAAADAQHMVERARFFLIGVLARTVDHLRRP